MDKRALWIGFLAGGWAATLAATLLPGPSGAPGGGWVRTASADDPQGMGPNGPNNPQLPAPVNPLEAQTDPRGVANPGSGTADSNNRAIALSSSMGSGQSAVWYFDTLKERVLVYQLEPGSRGGLKLLAARHFDYDLKLEAYNDVSESSRMELKEAYEEAFKASNAPAKVPGKGGLPSKNVQLPPGK